MLTIRNKSGCPITLFGEVFLKGELKTLDIPYDDTVERLEKNGFISVTRVNTSNRNSSNINNLTEITKRRRSKTITTKVSVPTNEEENTEIETN